MTANGCQLSVIIANVSGSTMIEACLGALARQQGDVDAEVIVANAAGEQAFHRIAEKFPWVKVLQFAERFPMPALRAAALKHSKGAIVAVVEDHCNPSEHWYEAIIESHRTHPECAAVGGVVENGSTRLVDWAMFLAEYSQYMEPMVGGVVHDIPGNNTSYKRAALEGIEDLAEELTRGFWETTLHPKLLALGEQFYSEPSVIVYHTKQFRFLHSLSQRFQYSRYYAGTFFFKAGLRTRFYRSCVSLVLPILLIVRTVRRLVQKKRHVKELILNVPLLTIITVVWAAGELVGSLFGPGDSLRRVE